MKCKEKMVDVLTLLLEMKQPNVTLYVYYICFEVNVWSTSFPWSIKFYSIIISSPRNRFDKILDTCNQFHVQNPLFTTGLLLETLYVL